MPENSAGWNYTRRNHRICILRRRGVNLDCLPRDTIERDTIEKEQE